MGSRQEERPGAAYLLSQVGGLEEAERLRRQAVLGLSQELPLLLRSLPQGGCFTDLGCGIGLLADAVAQARPDAQVRGVDADPLAVDQGRAHFGGRVSFERVRLEDGPPQGHPLADAAVLRLVLMHLPDPVAALKAAAAWLKPGGTLHVIEGDDSAIALEPPAFWLEPVLELMQRVQKARGGDRRLGRRLKALLEAAGWTVDPVQERLPDPSAAVRALATVFIPVAEFHLAEAGRLRLADTAKLEVLSLGMATTLAAGTTRASAPLFHAVARRAS